MEYMLGKDHGFKYYFVEHVKSEEFQIAQKVLQSANEIGLTSIYDRDFYLKYLALSTRESAFVFNIAKLG